MVRPSGTEPKVKIYCEVVLHDAKDLDEGEKEAARQADELLNAMKAIIKK